MTFGYAFDMPHGARRIAPWLLLVLATIVVGWLNYHATDDVQAVAAALLVFGFAFGFRQPGLAWLFAIVLFLGVPVSGEWAALTGYHAALLRPHPLYESLVALIPALVGAYAGAVTRVLTAAPGGSAPEP
jgi:hypothetical protein